MTLEALIVEAFVLTCFLLTLVAVACLVVDGRVERQGRR